LAAELRIDWTRCEARGVCLELLPDLLQPDDWGYPMTRGSGSKVPVRRAFLADAETAVRECPRLALRLTPAS
jgi:ferredoxin